MNKFAFALPLCLVSFEVYAGGPSSPYDWSGSYAGASLGFVAHSSEYIDINNWMKNGAGVNYGSTLARQMISANAGYNFQPLDNVVVGVEADLHYTIGSHTDTVSQISLTGYQQLKTMPGVMASLRGRLGFTFDRTLIYATGGMAFGSPTTKYIIGPSVILTGAVPSQFNSVGWTGGYVLGAGIEQALMQRLSIKAEALYYNLNSRDFTTFAASVPYAFKVNNSQMTVKIGVNLKL